jgi:hypothetical protein
LRYRMLPMNVRQRNIHKEDSTGLAGMPCILPLFNYTSDIA